MIWWHGFSFGSIRGGSRFHRRSSVYPPAAVARQFGKGEEVPSSSVDHDSNLEVHPEIALPVNESIDVKRGLLTSSRERYLRINATEATDWRIIPKPIHAQTQLSHLLYSVHSTADTASKWMRSRPISKGILASGRFSKARHSPLFQSGIFGTREGKTFRQCEKPMKIGANEWELLEFRID
ncbi:hypothetical protein AVEN_88367-1 [Araneus ventricosus]|uniref:Uncharacterized protein n=1 Tax=Araneus ventricosus TaxID=182803 RepID=A0A4Y2IBZ0_ARAVE|nr:hypothetical protein AVEN_88367-1 [Araneus ventricosus]